MSTKATEDPGSDRDFCTTEQEHAVYAYADGELDATMQPDLFAHLSRCKTCRRSLDAVMAFRMLSRSETVSVPPIADAALMARLDVLKKREDGQDQTHTLWERSLNVGLGRAAAALVVVFLLGAGFARLPAHETVPLVSASQENIAPVSGQELFWRVEPVYVFYPGLTIEAHKADRVEALVE